MTNNPAALPKTTSLSGLSPPLRLFLQNFGWLLFALLVATHAAFRGLHSDFDAEGYAMWFERIQAMDNASFLAGLSESNLYFSSDITFSSEIGFAILTFLISRVSSNITFFFFCIALLSFGTKLTAIRMYCRSPGWAIFWYLSWYYVLQEMTAIRSGVAAGLIMLGYGYLRDARYLRYLAVIAVACLFHVSAIFGLILIVIRKYEPTARTVLVLLFFAFLASYISILPLVAFLGNFIDKMAEYYLLYITLGLYQVQNNFNAVVLLRILILASSAVAILRDRSQNAPNSFELSVFAVSIIYYYALSSFPVVGGRASELLGVWQVFLVSSVFSRRGMWSLKGMIILTALVQFCILIFHIRLADFFYFFGDSYNIEYFTI